MSVPNKTITLDQETIPKLTDIKFTKLMLENLSESMSLRNKITEVILEELKKDGEMRNYIINNINAGVINSKVDESVKNYIKTIAWWGTIIFFIIVALLGYIINDYLNDFNELKDIVSNIRKI